MALVELNVDPSNRQLRQFGAIGLVTLPVAGWLWAHDGIVAGVAGAVGLTLFAMSLIAPRYLRPVFRGLTIVTLPIGLVAGEFVMLLIYFGLLLPTAIVFRITGRDQLRRRKPKEATTFWAIRKPPKHVRGYFDQF